MSDAIGSAIQATETINARSAQASEDARKAMALLKDAGEQAEATTRAAALAARQHADDTESASTTCRTRRSAPLPARPTPRKTA